MSHKGHDEYIEQQREMKEENPNSQKEAEMGNDIAKEYLEKRFEIAQCELISEFAATEGGLGKYVREELMFWKGAKAALDFMDVLKKEVA